MTARVFTPLAGKFFDNEKLVMKYFGFNAILHANALPLLKARLASDTSEAAQEIKRQLELINFDDVKYQFEYLQMEMSICRLVDNFHSYLIDMLRAYFRGNPDKLPKKAKSKSGPRKVSGMGKPLDHEIEVQAIAEVERLQLLGLEQVLKYLKTNVGISFDISDDTLREAEYSIGLRNIITHNRGRTNERFARRLKDDNLDLDTPMLINPDDPHRCFECLTDIVETLDLAFTTKLGMELFASHLPFPTLTEGVRFGP